MPKLFESVLADLEFTKRNEVKIEDVVIFLKLDQFSQKSDDACKIVCSSGDFQDFVIKTLDPETISQPRDFWIFLIQGVHKIQCFFFRIRIKLNSQFS